MNIQPRQENQLPEVGLHFCVHSEEDEWTGEMTEQPHQVVEQFESLVQSASSIKTLWKAPRKSQRQGLKDVRLRQLESHLAPWLENLRGRFESEGLKEEIDNALSEERFLDARKLSVKASERYPNDSHFKKMLALLGPPQASMSDLPAKPAHKGNSVWLKKHRLEYKGKWVALRDGELLETARSLRRLIQKVGKNSDFLLTRVF